jgi:hypothetical protein
MRASLGHGGLTAMTTNKFRQRRYGQSLLGVARYEHAA